MYKVTYVNAFVQYVTHIEAPGEVKNIPGRVSFVRCEAWKGGFIHFCRGHFNPKSGKSGLASCHAFSAHEHGVPDDAKEIARLLSE